MLITVLAALSATLSLYPEAKAAVADILALGQNGVDPTQAEVDAAIAASNVKLAQAQADADGPTLSL